MTIENSSAFGDWFDIAAAMAVITGVLVFGYGLLLVPASVLGGAHVAAIGLCLVLSGLFAIGRIRERLGLSVRAGRRLSLACAVLAAVLLVAFVVVNFASFEAVEFEESS